MPIHKAPSPRDDPCTYVNNDNLSPRTERVIVHRGVKLITIVLS